MIQVAVKKIRRAEKSHVPSIGGEGLFLQDLEFRQFAQKNRAPRSDQDCEQTTEIEVATTESDDVDTAF